MPSAAEHCAHTLHLADYYPGWTIAGLRRLQSRFSWNPLTALDPVCRQWPQTCDSADGEHKLVNSAAQGGGTNSHDNTEHVRL